jgi:hypothetical protein
VLSKIGIEIARSLDESEEACLFDDRIARQHVQRVPDLDERDAGQHERVLHVDDDQRGPGWIEVAEGVFGAAPLDDPVHRPTRNVDLAHAMSSSV